MLLHNWENTKTSHGFFAQTQIMFYKLGCPFVKLQVIIVKTMNQSDQQGLTTY